MEPIIYWWSTRWWVAPFVVLFLAAAIFEPVLEPLDNWAWDAIFYTAAAAALALGVWPRREWVRRFAVVAAGMACLGRAISNLLSEVHGSHIVALLWVTTALAFNMCAAMSWWIAQHVERRKRVRAD